MGVRRFWRDLLGTGTWQDVGEDLLALGTSAVMGRAMPLGDTLVLPSLVVFTLPAEELQLFSSSRLQEGLSRSLQRSVQQRTAEQLARLRRVHGNRVMLLGGDDLRIRLVEGEARDAEARFETRTPSMTADAPTVQAPAGWPAGAAAAVDAAGATEPLTALESGPGASAAPDARTELDTQLRLVLRSDGVVVGAVFPTAGRLLVGRDPASSLVVPQAKEKVSRQALWATRGGVAAVDVEVVGRNGAWVCRRPPDGAGPARERVGPGRRARLDPGDRVELDRAGTVTLALEGVRDDPSPVS